MFQWVSYDLDSGRVEFEFIIPTAWDKINLMEIKTNLKQKLDAYVTHLREYHFNVKELFYMYKPIRFTQILPPFDGK